MNLPEIKGKLDQKLEKKLISSRIIFNRFRLLNNESKLAAAYTDPTYAPFYYYLGTMTQPKSVVQLGLGLGLLSGAYFIGCKTAEEFLGFHPSRENVVYTPRLAIKNIRDVFKGHSEFYVGDITDEIFNNKIINIKWDMALITDTANYDSFMGYLDLIWENMNLDGLIVMDHLDDTPGGREAFLSFCKTHNREPYFFETRYGIGVTSK